MILNSQIPRDPRSWNLPCSQILHHTGRRPAPGCPSVVSPGYTPRLCRSLQMTPWEGVQSNSFLFYLYFILIFKVFILFIYIYFSRPLPGTLPSGLAAMDTWKAVLGLGAELLRPVTIPTAGIAAWIRGLSGSGSAWHPEGIHLAAPKVSLLTSWS